VFASDDAAATVTAARTVADGGIEGLPPRRVSPHDASTRWEKGIAIKTEPRILVFRRNTRYYNWVYVAVCGLSIDGLTFFSFTFVVRSRPQYVFRRSTRRPGTGEFPPATE
jgi:hypothetical protein